MKWGHVAVGTFLMAWLTGGAAANAAGVAVPSTVEPGHQVTPSPPPPQSDFDFTIDQPRGSKDTRSLSQLKFHVVDIVVDGADTLPPREIKIFTAPLIGETVTLGALSKVAESIEAYYHAKGYLLSRAFVPAQRTRDGIFHIRVIEGRIAAVTVTGARPGTREQAEHLMAPVIGQTPLESDTIERGLLLTNDLPGVTASGTLEPGAVDKTSNLNVVVKQPLVQGSVGADNRTSMYAGPWETNGTVNINSLFHQGEQISLYGGFTLPRPLGSITSGGRFTLPFGDGWTTTSGIDYGHGQPGYSIDRLRIRTDSLQMSQTLDYAYIRQRAVNLTFDGGVAWHMANTDALSAEVSRDRWTTLSAGVRWSEAGHWFGGTTSGTADLVQGLPIFASDRGDPLLSRVGAEPTGTKATATVERLQPIKGPVSLYAAASGQIAFSKLLSGEQFSLGGTQFGRGFDPSVASGDNGAALTLEARYDFGSYGHYLQNTELYLFNDAGIVSNILNTPGYPLKIDSIGIGTRVSGQQGWNGNLELDDVVDGPNDSRGGHGVRLFAGVNKTF